MIITSGMPRKPVRSRLIWAQANVNIIKDIITPQIVKGCAECDLYHRLQPGRRADLCVHKRSPACPSDGSSAPAPFWIQAVFSPRWQKRFRISPKNVHAHVYGEHGDLVRALVSGAHWSNHVNVHRESSPDHDRIKWDNENEYAAIGGEFVPHLRRSGHQGPKGATFYASVCHLCKCCLNTAGTALTISTMMHGEYGVEDVCLSTLALVDRNGVRGKILNTLTDDEVAKLHHSADKLKEVIHQIEI